MNKIFKIILTCSIIFFIFLGFLLGVNNDNSSPVKDIFFWDQYNEACVSGDKESAYKDILSNYLYDYFIYYEGKVHSPLNGRFCGEQEECIAFKSIPNKEKELINYLENSKERINDYLFDSFFEEIQRRDINKADLSIRNNKYSYLVGAPAGEVVLLNDCCYFINRDDLPEFEKTIFRDEKTDDFIRIDSYLYKGVAYSGSTAFVKNYFIKPINLCEDK